ncbi:MAG: hypothetical protein A2077_02985 [Nitrospirae bacterium GWC2_46_6]|nr:MAG: hypothetical protein A2077_02985 [Nitrospirae bacterium GWC2_46_6]OGW25293.1 MAG: hypothetical protein A2X55_11435 [Nitrospirae bacterium GWB2_47_37]HAK87964.1 hypothetical protein [Nitrospiraceae bacterium]HCZ12868.1 hypothetical protein [Nitrospiraceae bacterium]
MNHALSDSNYWDDIYVRGRRKYTYPDLKGNRFHIKLSRLLRKHLKRGSNALEIGCGGSIWLPYLMNKFGCHVTGIDFSEEGLKKAEEHLKPVGNNYELHLMDFLKPDERLFSKFDMLFSLGVIEHFENPSELIKIFKQFLKPDGLMITWVPNTAGLIMKLQKFADIEIYERHKAFDFETFMKYHTGNGLEIVEASPIRFMDLSMINIYRLPIIQYKIITNIAKIVNIPFLWLEKYLGYYLKSEYLSASLYAITRRTEDN